MYTFGGVSIQLLPLIISSRLHFLLLHCFRFGRHFELPLLAQSFIMIAAMMAMLQLCAKIQRETDISGKRRSILGRLGLSVVF